MSNHYRFISRGRQHHDAVNFPIKYCPGISPLFRGNFHSAIMNRQRWNDGMLLCSITQRDKTFLDWERQSPPVCLEIVGNYFCFWRQDNFGRGYCWCRRYNGFGTCFCFFFCFSGFLTGFSFLWLLPQLLFYWLRQWLP